ncbi:hypothetical protein KC685_03445 [Candidatus Dojkabacteria bacterium]|uniref:Uncharacterized protein n=1 Tax=Candidatus Dojkabacteria bacterium TaxID=2099670 RepID=A0A955I1V7_9BACT|nr:hypothetical protein [Candidatus Dojkabacteria bacterium]
MQPPFTPIPITEYTGELPEILQGLEVQHTADRHLFLGIPYEPKEGQEIVVIVSGLTGAGKKYCGKRTYDIKGTTSCRYCHN